VYKNIGSQVLVLDGFVFRGCPPQWHGVWLWDLHFVANGAVVRAASHVVLGGVLVLIGQAPRQVGPATR
jgi:hypothetical protein